METRVGYGIETVSTGRRARQNQHLSGLLREF